MTSRPRIRRSREDLQRELSEQLELLRRACREFDEGFEAIGRHIALSLRVLLHEHGRSRALLDQLGLREGRFLDTAGPLNPKNFAPEHNLVVMEISTLGGRYLPLIATGGNPEREVMIPFADWWNHAVIKDAKGHLFSRRELVTAVADTDGGAHVDPALDEAYMQLSRHNSLGWSFGNGDRSEPFRGRPELASVRQIAHELLATLSRRSTSLAVDAAPVIPAERPAAAAFASFQSVQIEAADGGGA